MRLNYLLYKITLDYHHLVFLTFVCVVFCTSYDVFCCHLYFLYFNVECTFGVRY